MTKKAPSAPVGTEPLFDVTSHTLVPLHELCSQKEKDEVLRTFGAQAQQMPRIRVTDAGIAHLGAKEGDLIRITRKSSTAGTTTFYRIVSVD